MAGDEVKRRKTHRHKHGDPGMPKPRKRSEDDSTTSKSPATTDSPADIDALRKARLTYLAKSPEERRNDMKYEYIKRTKTSEADEEKDKRHKAVRGQVIDREDRKPERRSTTRTDSNRRAVAQDESEDDYVYSRNERSSGARSTGATQIETTRTQRTKSQSQNPKKTETTRRAPERRYTEPARRKEVYVFDEVPCAGKEAHPLPRRMSIVTEKPRKPEIKRSVTTVKPKVEVGVAESEVATTPKKGSGLLSGLLPPKPAPQRKVSCLTCGDDEIPVAQSALLPCKHRMCNTCLKRVFKMSVSDPAHMPPRCCTDQHIALKHVEKLFDDKFKVLWNRKFQEYKTKNRVYCPGRKCGAWIKPHYITIENGRKMHTTRECPKDPETKAFIETAKEKGWQRCYSCHAMVELKEGCNHMTCRCTAEFCMVCGLKWKSCDCPWFNYEAVDANMGDPMRYQQEMDRRRDQVNRDEELARRMQQMGLGDDGEGPAARMFGLGNGANHHMNQNFIQQAREALTANYAQAGQAAMGLLNGFVVACATQQRARIQDGELGDERQIDEDKLASTKQEEQTDEFMIGYTAGLDMTGTGSSFMFYEVQVDDWAHDPGISYGRMDRKRRKAARDGNLRLLDTHGRAYHGVGNIDGVNRPDERFRYLS
ncbi:hypothetical protein AYO20_04878 [Fonsecaea nubica]|uniref:RING-type domain-containing protein n=1 Tax=Fonsecaea nubica TaxID=856822 RepID=A0A178D0U3_9EURO|nr:hypothetical protein AYO20_04878 [Fonsecaea nubica]OAL35728.1 hypothetical protein AYO20_04878 [Fonsecaea nubica]